MSKSGNHFSSSIVYQTLPRNSRSSVTLGRKELSYSTTSDLHINMPNTATNPIQIPQTPQSLPVGTTIVSEQISTIGLEVSNICPWIAPDVERFTTCPIDEMLKVLLGDCRDDRVPKTSFEDCLDRVLPICNGKFQAEGCKEESSCIKLKSHLATYADKWEQHENKLHHFAQAANIAFRCLEELEVEGIRSRDTSRLYFHVNDPQTLTQDHQGQTSTRRPNLVLVSVDDVRHACSEGDIYQPEEIEAAKPPKFSFNWRAVRMFVECKTSKIGIAKPLKAYTNEPATQNSTRGYLTVHDGPDLAQSITPSASSASYNTTVELPIPIRRSACQQENAASSSPDSRKRTSEHLEVAESSSKRQRAEPKKRDPVIIQAGSYAAEMFAAHMGRQHVFGVIVVDDLLYLWGYDRQGAIKCSALNFITDLPRFLVLLLAMQRFQNHHWGLNPNIDPDFGDLPSSHKMTLRPKQGGEIKFILDLSSKEPVTHFGLNGRATDVFPVTSEQVHRKDGLVAKVFWAQEARKSEPDILEEVNKIAERVKDVEGHVPDMVCYQAFADSSTAVIRRRLNISIDGARILYVIIFRKLKPITALVGKDFLRTWWAAVKCHRALWREGIYHRDISPSNLMFYMEDEGPVAVLNDFDLASIGNGPTGTERTGTVPFMALALLKDEAIQGECKHEYEYDAQSFIWVLIWICLRYDDGVLRRRNRPLDDWLKVDAKGCHKEKSSFLSMWQTMEAGAGHENNWDATKECIKALGMYRAHKLYARRSTNAATAFEELLEEPITPFL